MTLNYQRVVERFPNPNKGVGGLICGCEIFSLLDGKTKSPPSTRWVVNPPCTKGSLSRVGPTGSIHVGLPAIVLLLLLLFSFHVGHFAHLILMKI